MIECPYCGHEQDEPDDCFDTGVTFEDQCIQCEKYFVFTVDYTISYDAEKAPCLNGEPHKWRERVGHPDCDMKGRFDCVYCDKHEDRITPDVRKKMINDYMESLK